MKTHDNRFYPWKLIARWCDFIKVDHFDYFWALFFYINFKFEPSCSIEFYFWFQHGGFLTH